MTQYLNNNNKLLAFRDFRENINPQLVREIKVRFKRKNIIWTTIFSLITQFVVVIYFLGRLPDVSYQITKKSSEIIYSIAYQYSRYCTGKESVLNSNTFLCHQDMANHWLIDWRLFWFDIFLSFSVISSATLLIIGTFLLVDNIIKERQADTLSLLCLSPQPVTDILLGKIFGVPSLVYLFATLVLPLQTIAGLQARIPLSLIMNFYGAIFASCAFFYSLALLLCFFNSKVTQIRTFLLPSVIALFLLLTTNSNLNNDQSHIQNIFDWLLLFNPNNLIIYLGKITAIPQHHFNYPELNLWLNNLNFSNFFDSTKRVAVPNTLNNLIFYGQPLGEKIAVGLGIVIANYCFWTYWLWQGLKRRFTNIESTIITKKQSYWITAYFCAISMGFALNTTQSELFLSNFLLLEIVIFVFSIALIFALSPQKQILQDWARYHQRKANKTLLFGKELLLGEKSPSLVAVALNLFLIFLYIVPALVIFPVSSNRIALITNLGINLSMILLIFAIAQWLLLVKSDRRMIYLFSTILSSILVLPIALSLIEVTVSASPLAWLISSFPLIGLQNTSIFNIALTFLGQWLAIAIVSIQITKKLQQAGRSESYKVLNNS